MRERRPYYTVEQLLEAKVISFRLQHLFNSNIFIDWATCRRSIHVQLPLLWETSMREMNTCTYRWAFACPIATPICDNHSSSGRWSANKSTVLSQGVTRRRFNVWSEIVNRSIKNSFLNCNSDICMFLQAVGQPKGVFLKVKLFGSIST